MAEKDKSNSFENLITRAFVLLRKWMKKGDLTEPETLELLEIQKTMATTDFRSEFTSFREVMETKMDSQNAKIDAQNTKYNVLIWAIGFAGLVISAAILFSDKI